MRAAARLHLHPRVNRNVNAAEGFLLVEVLVAGVIVVIGVVALAQLFTLAVAANLAARHRTEAIVLAAAKIEELRASRWGEEPDGSAGDRVGIYTRRWSVHPVAARNGMAVVIDVRITRGPIEEARLVTVKVRSADPLHFTESSGS
jgi:Tfp pilus assembly protein PilV